MTAPLLSIEALSAVSKRDGGQPILRDVSLRLERGEVRGLVGESGAGKSTIAKALLGILPATVEVTGGWIRFDGRDLLKLDARSLRDIMGSEISLIPQDPQTALNPGRRIEAQLTDGLRLKRGMNRADARKKALTLLEEVHIRDPERVLAAYPHQLSGGMRQRILIAAAFALEPKLVVADEPTTALDVTVQKQILRVIRRMQEAHGTGVIFVTHDLGVVAQICDSVTLLYAGKVIEDGRTADLLTQPKHAYTKALLAAGPRYDRPDAGLEPVPEAVFEALEEEIGLSPRATTAALTPSSAGQHKGRELEKGKNPIAAPPEATWLLTASGVEVTYGGGNSLFGTLPGVKVLHGIDIAIIKGETIGIVGESGSGKTTLGRALLGLIDTSAGKIMFDGRDITMLDDATMQPLRRRMQMIFQDPMASLNPRHSIRRILGDPLKLHGIAGSDAEADGLLKAMLDRVSLPHVVLGRNPHELSGGQRQRIGIARAALLKPDFVLADEIVSGLDVSTQAQVLKLLKELSREMGLSMAFISHDLSVIRAVCDRVYVMRFGKVVEEGACEKVFADPQSDYTRTLLDAIPLPEIDPDWLARGQAAEAIAAP